MNTETIAVFIPIIAIIMGIGAGIVGIVSQHRQRVQRADLRHKERMVALEKGIDLPPEPVETEYGKPRYLLKGLVYSGVGASLFFALRAVAGEDVSLFAMIPLAIGVAYLVYYWLRGRHEEQPAADAQAVTRP